MLKGQPSPRALFATKALAISNLFRRAQPDPNSGCWLWEGELTPQGYGVVKPYREGGRRYGAHRLAFEAANGREPTGFVLHSCDTPVCVNPAHLREGSAAENTRDAVGRGRIVIPTMREGWGKRDEAMRERILILFDAGLSRAAIHAQTGHSARTIRKVLKECRS